MGVSPRSRSINAACHQYHTLYPAARIISIRSIPEFFMTTRNSTRLGLSKAIVPAIESDTSREKRILVHLFSNGGALSFSDACHVYKEHTGRILPVKALVLDSAPGDPNLKEAWAAMSIGLPKGILWYPAAALTLLGLGIAWTANSILRIPTLVIKTRGWLNDWDLVDKTSKRLYIYSEADKLVGWRDVERHFDDARTKGSEAMILKEADTPHVQHMYLDRERYWMKVKELWESSSS
jgi:hypothetical protein